MLLIKSTTNHSPIFLVSFLYFGCVFTPSLANKNDDPVVHMSFFGTDAFSRKVQNTIQTRKNVDLDCKSSNLFSFYDFSQTCRSCEAVCDVKSPSNTCLDKCEGYLDYQKSLAEIKIRDEEIDQLFMLIIGGGIWIAVITLILVAVMIFGALLIRHVKKNFEPRHPNQVAPEDDCTPVVATKTEGNRDDHEYIGSESGFLSNHSTYSQC